MVLTVLDPTSAELERLQRQQDALAEELASDAPTRKKQEREERLLKAISGAKSTTRFEVPRRGPEVHAPALRSAAVYIPHPESKAMDDVTKKARRFCLDLQPKLLLSRGSAVPLLVESGTASYLEFQAVNPLFIQVQDKGHPVQVCSSPPFAACTHDFIGPVFSPCPSSGATEQISGLPISGHVGCREAEPHALAAADSRRSACF